MNALNEIRARLCVLVCFILVPLFNDYYPPGSGWTGIYHVMLVCVTGIVLGCFFTNLLITFKKWWKQ